VDDISNFAKVVRVIYEQGYDASKVVQTYTDIDTLKGHYKVNRQLNADLENKRERLAGQVALLENQARFYQQSQSETNQLTQLGFSLKVLKQLHGLLIEISDSNDQPTGYGVIQRFFDDISQGYDSKLGLEIGLKKRSLGTNLRKG
jgi:hypothetical protein